MKIKTLSKSYEEVLALPKPEKLMPHRPSRLLQKVISILGKADLKATDFTYTMEGMEKLGDEPCLILMNHSAFIDLEIVNRIFAPRLYNIVCTSDGFVGKAGLMLRIGAFPTQKFVRDLSLISDMNYCLKELKTSVLIYPEASYTFDGCPTPLPQHMGILLKRLGVPVVSVLTHGAFARDPLYNLLQKRKVKVSAEVRCLYTSEELKAAKTEEIDAVLDRMFSFDNFAWQYENKVEINEPFRADGLHRILYKCCECGTEGQMEGKGTDLVCHACGHRWHMNTLGRLENLPDADKAAQESVPAAAKNPAESVPAACAAQPRFPHIPDWYRWERQEVIREIEQGSYVLDTDVEIGMMVDYKAIYMIGSGHLHHDTDGFHLTGADGKLDYVQNASACYSLYADYYWYELGDIICIGNKDALYYCFPKNTPVAKTRMAAEEIFKSARNARRKRTPQD